MVADTANYMVDVMVGVGDVDVEGRAIVAMDYHAGVSASDAATVCGHR